MLEERQVVELDAEDGGYRLKLDNGEAVRAQTVIVAVGITHFAWMPEALRGLPPERAVHAAAIREPEALRGRKVTVVGAGASAIDLSALLHESGAEVTLLARREALEFHQPPRAKRTLWNRMRWPQTGLGPGWKSKFCTDAPLLFHRLPEKLRLKIVERHLGPSAGWPMRERVMGHVPLLLGQTIERAATTDGGVRLELKAKDGSRMEHRTEMVVAATGYRVDLRRLPFLAAGLREKITELEQTPVLSAGFESSVPGLYFTGLAAANSLGPMLRFAYGSDFAARRVTKAVAAHLKRDLRTVEAGR
jgi:thioredoxin reductase